MSDTSLDNILISSELSETYNNLEPSLNNEGFEIVKLAWVAGEIRTLQILLERSDSGKISIDECRDQSNKISALLDVYSGFTEKYNLEVSSSGIDRPLSRLKDFEKYKDMLCKLKLVSPLEGRAKFKGFVKNVEENIIHFKDEEGIEFSFSFKRIDNAKLILTDELIRQALRDSKK